MAEMAVTVLGSDLNAAHAKRVVFLGDDMVGFDGLYKAWPATAAIELVARGKKWLARDDINIKSVFLVIPEIISKRRFGAAF